VTELPSVLVGALHVRERTPVDPLHFVLESVVNGAKHFGLPTNGTLHCWGVANTTSLAWEFYPDDPS
jgi:hypothetical protein